jgi:Holliday junction DNA helicase RuvA
MMIGKLRGVIDHIERDSAILDVNGVGYVVYCSSRTLAGLPPLGTGDVTLIIETHVREDHIHLYGFKDYGERACFRELTTVKGVGSKVALAILGSLTPQAVATALAAQDRAAFTQISGIGPKLADRILTELKSTVLHEHLSLGGDLAPQTVAAAGGTSSQVSDAVSALVNLGYSRSDAFRVATNISAAEPSLTISEVIKRALKELTA